MEFRCARHTDNLRAITDFYTNILMLEVLFSFENHNNYSGVFIGKTGHDWHLEFTSSHTRAEHSFDDEDLLVFYPTERTEYNSIIQRIETSGLEKLTPSNPYWSENGVMIKDPDGFGIIVSHLKTK